MNLQTAYDIAITAPILTDLAEIHPHQAAA